LFFNYIIKNQSIDKCDISPVNWVYPILTGHIYVLGAGVKKEREDKNRATQHSKLRISTLDNTEFSPKKYF
jgi:hypothetical protein